MICKCRKTYWKLTFEWSVCCNAAWSNFQRCLNIFFFTLKCWSCRTSSSSCLLLSSISACLFRFSWKYNRICFCYITERNFWKIFNDKQVILCDNETNNFSLVRMTICQCSMTNVQLLASFSYWNALCSPHICMHIRIVLILLCRSHLLMPRLVNYAQCLHAIGQTNFQSLPSASLKTVKIQALISPKLQWV